MEISAIDKQILLLQNKERILREMKKYPNVICMGVGIKETNNELTASLCYRVYVSEKKPVASLKENEIIPANFDGFITDVLPYGVVEEIKTDTLGEIDKPIRPLKGGIRIKNDLFEDNKDNLARGTGTLGCLVYMDDGTERIVGLTNAHVVCYNSEDITPELSDREIGQPRKVICCCCCVKNIVGKVLDFEKDNRRDCAIIQIHDDLVEEIKNGGTINMIHEIGNFSGKAIAVADPDNKTLVKKRGAGTGLTHGKVVDVDFGNGQLLITAVGDDDRFADFGDSGSIVVDEGNRVVGLLWGLRRDRRYQNDGELSVITDTMSLNDFPRIYGVATPIEMIEQRMKIKIPTAPDVIPTFSIHTDDTKTYEIPSTWAPEKKPKKHFVTVRGEGDIILKVTFDQPVDGSRVKWTSSNPDVQVTFPGVGTDRLTARISRSITRGARTTIGVSVDGSSVGKGADVWVIWTTSFIQHTEKYKVEIMSSSTFVSKNFAVRYEIQPTEIINADMENNDLPDLRSANETNPPNVADSDIGVFNKGVDLKDGAKMKWDGSARLRYKTLHPGIFITGDFYDILPNYPTDPIVGNFDLTASSLDGNPYTNMDLNTLGAFSHDVTVSFEMPRNMGIVNSIVNSKIQLQQFARLELNKHWYVISQLNPWKIHLELIKKSEFDDQVDYDGDGVMTLEDWIELPGKIEVNADNDGF